MAQETRPVVVVFCDVCDFGSIKEEDEGRALAIARAALAFVQQAAEGQGGRLIRDLGDGMLVGFPTASNAVQSSIDLQKALARRNAQVEPRERFQLRVEIHAGDVEIRDGEVFCNGVNVAARVELLAAPGGIRMSREVLELIHNRLCGG